MCRLSLRSASIVFTSTLQLSACLSKLRGQTGIAERATTILAIRCHDVTALERKLRSHFARKGRHPNEGGGKEWFKCRPEEILELVGCR